MTADSQATRNMAQFGGALPLGGRSRRFESCYSDLAKRSGILYNHPLLVAIYTNNALYTDKFAKLTYRQIKKFRKIPRYRLVDRCSIGRVAQWVEPCNEAAQVGDSNSPSTFLRSGNLLN